MLSWSRGSIDRTDRTARPGQRRFSTLRVSAADSLPDHRAPGDWKHLYQQLLTRPGCQDLVSQLVSYVTNVSDDDHKDLRSAYASISKPAEETFMTAAKQLIQEGHDQGLSQGLEQGLSQGLQAGQASALITILQQRFGELPDALIDKVISAPVEALERWMPRVLTAESASDVIAS